MLSRHISNRGVARTTAVLALMVTSGMMASAGTASAIASPTLIADAYTDASAPAKNYGTRTTVRTDNSPVLITYLKFSVPELSDPLTGHVRVFVSSSAKEMILWATSAGWDEKLINHNNRPALGAEIARIAGAARGTWVTFDVSAWLAANVHEAGDVSFALTTASSTAVAYGAREGNAGAQLLVPSPAATDYFYVAPSATGYTATGYADDNIPRVVYNGSVKTVVERAVADLKSIGGGVVQFSAGTFDLGSEYLKLEDVRNITFAGEGIDATLLKNHTDASADTEPFNFSGAWYIVIRDITISAGGVARSTSDAIDFDEGNHSLVENVSIIASRSKGIVFDGKNTGWTSEYNTVRGSFIDGVQGTGIELLASTNNVIENNLISNTARYGIHMVKGSTSAGQPNKKASFNTIRYNTIVDAGHDGINVTSSDSNVIEGNTIKNSSDDTTGRDGIRLIVTDSITAEDNVVRANVAFDDQTPKTQNYGVYINNALVKRTQIVENTLTGNKTGEIRNLGTDTFIG